MNELSPNDVTFAKSSVSQTCQAEMILAQNMHYSPFIFI